jgi:hypothetical protein
MSPVPPVAMPGLPVGFTQTVPSGAAVVFPSGDHLSDDRFFDDRLSNDQGAMSLEDDDQFVIASEGSRDFETIRLNFSNA